MGIGTIVQHVVSQSRSVPLDSLGRQVVSVPSGQVEMRMGAVTIKSADSATWDNDSGEVAVPEGCVGFLVRATAAAKVFVDASTDDPTDGMDLAAGVQDMVPASYALGDRYLHYVGDGSAATISIIPLLNVAR